MPCFSCRCFSDGKGRHGERLSGGRGYCVIRDQEYWRGHECGDFAPIWNGSKSLGSVLEEPKNYGFLDIFKKRLKPHSCVESAMDDLKDENLDIFEAFNESDEDEDINELDTDELDELDEEEFDDLDDEELDELDDEELFEMSDESECISQDMENISDEPVVSQPSKRLETVQKNITIDDTVFRKYEVVFNFNLVEVYDDLQLNFELNNVRRLISKMRRDDDFVIKANVYDAGGRLLCIDENWVGYRELKSNYASDYFYFSNDLNTKAHSIRIYAIDPSDDEIEEEDFLGVSKVLTDKQQCLLNNAVEAKSVDIPESDEYIYCTLSFESGGKTYYYKTKDASLKCGDEVIVPIGNGGRKGIAKIEKIERVVYGKEPYPLSLTKDILGICPY